MELFLDKARYDRFFNCSGIDVESVPMSKRQHVAESIITMWLTSFYYILYIPCMFSIWKHIKNSTCYQILFYIGLLDLFELAVIGFLQSAMSLGGIVYCNSPTLVYLSGVAEAFNWYGETAAELVLAFNRCLGVIWPELAAKLFDGHRTAIWLGACTLNTLYWFLFGRPVMFSSVGFGWYYNPFAGYKDDPETQAKYTNPAQDMPTTIVLIFLPACYILFAVFLCLKRTMMHQDANGSKLSAAEKSSFVQVFCISLLHVTSILFCMLKQYISVSDWMTMLGQFAWLQIHGFPPVIYLALNKTIRNDCRLFIARMVGPVGIQSKTMVQSSTMNNRSTQNGRMGAGNGPVANQQSMPMNSLHRSNTLGTDRVGGIGGTNASREGNNQPQQFPMGVASSSRY